MPATAAREALTTNQIRGFWAAWGGWALDGMDSFIYALVLVPALRDLLPRSGILPTQANIGFYGGVLFAIFLVGWGFSFLWGPLADRFGRKPILAAGVALYTGFALLCAIARSFELLIAGRVAMGASAAVTRVLVTAMVRDLFEGEAMARVMSLVFMVFMLVPVLAPT